MKVLSALKRENRKRVFWGRSIEEARQTLLHFNFHSEFDADLPGPGSTYTDRVETMMNYPGQRRRSGNGNCE